MNQVHPCPRCGVKHGTVQYGRTYSTIKIERYPNGDLLTEEITSYEPKLQKSIYCAKCLLPLTKYQRGVHPRKRP